MSVNTYECYGVYLCDLCTVKAKVDDTGPALGPIEQYNSIYPLINRTGNQGVRVVW